MTGFAVAAPRGCGGSRTEGGIYFESAHGPGGKPVEFFLIDPPEPIPDGMNLSSIGVQLIEVDGVHHIVDVIGREHYPNVADYLEEVRRLGVSRRLSSTLDYSKITEQTRLFVVHDRAIVPNMADWFEYPGNESPHCPKGIEGHPKGVECCAWVWWNDVEGGQPVSKLNPDYDGGLRGVVRHLPGCTYKAYERPDNVTPTYRRGFFARFPLGRLVVVKGARSAENLEKIRQSKVRTEEVDE